MEIKRIIFKIVLIGDGTVGKTSILKKYFYNEIDYDYIMTIGFDVFTKRELIMREHLHLEILWQLWDIAGQPHWKDVVSSFYRGAKGGIAVFDIANKISFDSINDWVNDFVKQVGNKPIILVGNKVDLRDKIPDPITYEEGIKKAEELSKILGRNVPYVETSALTGEGIKEAFSTIRKMIFRELVGMLRKSKKLS